MRFDQIKTFTHDKWNLDKKGFYAILGGPFDSTSSSWKNLVLLYIGQAFAQTLRERISQKHPAYDCVFEYQKKHPSVDIIVKIGFVEKSTVQALTQQLFDDVECCLTYCNQPLCNTTCKESYTGRDLQVINMGDYTSLREKCFCSKTQT